MVKKIKISQFNYLIIVVFILTYFLFDINMITGTDNAWYLDLSYLISKNNLFLQDYFDYRLPVFSYIFSPIYKFNFSESWNVYILLCLVYGCYTLVIYTLFKFVSKNSKISLFTSILTFLSVASRSFDSARNICQPLFHHTLELVAIILVWYVFNYYEQIKNFFRYFLIFIAGFIFFINLSGRQVQVFPILLFLFFIFRNFNKNYFNRKDTLINFFLFALGVIIALGILCYIFYIPNINYTYQVKYWLYDIPLNIHTHSLGPIEFIRRFGGIVSSFFGYFTGLNLPIINLFYFLITLSITSFLFSSKKINIIIFLNENKNFISILLCVILSHIINTFPTGTDAPRYQTNVFTLFGLGVAYFLVKINFLNISKFNYILLLIPFLFSNFIFVNKEYNSYKNSQIQKNKTLFNSVISLELENYIIKDKTPILVLGGQSIVGRIAKYKPFLGFVSDVTLFSHSKKNPKLFMKEFEKKFHEVDIVYKTPDYPNLSVIGDDSTNKGFIFIEKELKENFQIIKILKPINSYPYSYNKPVIIYKRK